MKAVILAAGEGTRLQPLTENRPKHLIPIAGKPILQWLVESLRECSVSEILLIVGRWKDALLRQFGNGADYGVEIKYTVQPSVDGTARALQLSEGFVKNEPILLIYGDILVSSDQIRRVIDIFRGSDCVAAMALAAVDHPEFYGVVEVRDEYVETIAEKPPPSKTHGNLVNAGVYVLKPTIFEFLKVTPRSRRREYEITDSLKLMLKKDHKIRSVKFDAGSWVDIGRPWDVLGANGLALKRLEPRVDGEVEQGVNLLGHVVVEKGARIRSGSYLEGPILVMSGADVGPNCHIRSSTTLGRNVRVGNACEIKNSVLMNDAKVPHLSYVGDSIIGERCNLAAGTIVANLRFDRQPIKMTIGGRPVDTGRRKLGVILGDDVETGVNCSLMPGVKIGSGTRVEPGTVVYEDLPAGSSHYRNVRPKKRR